MQNKYWARLLAYVTGLVNQQLLQQNEYLAAENRILRSHLPARLWLSDPERSTLAEIGKRLGRRGLEQVACVAPVSRQNLIRVENGAIRLVPRIEKRAWTRSRVALRSAKVLFSRGPGTCGVLI
jgi:hypothetical protein